MGDICIIGMGAVGTATAGALLRDGLASRLTLVDANHDKARGEALDFRHAGALYPRCQVEARTFDELSPADIVVLTAGVKTRPGESRLNLIDRNLAAADDIATRLERTGLPRTLLVLTNPVDAMTEYFSRRWENRGCVVFGSGTALDSQRLREALATRLGVGSASVHAWVVGEHGDSSVCLFSSARVGALPLEDFARQVGRELEASHFADLESSVRTAAYDVIRLKGATAHAIGLTAGALVKAMVRNERIVVPVSVRVPQALLASPAFGLSEGPHGPLCASLPCVLGEHGPETILRPAFHESEAKAFGASLRVLEDVNSRLPLHFPSSDSRPGTSP